MQALTRATLQRVLAIVAVAAIAMVGLVSFVQPAQAATTKSVKVTATGFTHSKFPQPDNTSGAAANGLYVAAFDKDADLSKVTMENMDETVAGNAAWVTKSKVGNGDFSTTLSEVPTGKAYQVVTWVAHGNISDGTILSVSNLSASGKSLSIKWDGRNSKVAGERPHVKAGTATISGTAKVGSKLTVSPGTWTSGTKRSYQWYKYSGGKWVALQGAVGKKHYYTPVPALVGKKLLVKVTGTKTGYQAVAKRKTTKAVARGTQTLSTPAISGTAKAGKTLTTKVSKKTSGAKVTYQWYKAKASVNTWYKVSGATKSTYKVPSSLKGKRVLVKATAKKSGYTTVSKNSAIKKIAK